MLNIWNNGDCAVLIDWRIPLKSAVEMMRGSQVNKCYIEKVYLKNGIADRCPDIDFLTFEKSGEYYVEELPTSIYEKFNENYSQKEALVLYSSGTTGNAKGIILSHYAINLNADLINEYMQLSNRDSIYIVKAFAHSSTIVGELLIGLKYKIKNIVSSTLVSPRDSLNHINNYKVTILCLNPSLLYLYTVTAKMKKMKF